MNLSYQQLDPLIHQPARLSIMAALVATKEVEFGTMRDMINISDSLLSRHMTMLEKADYIQVRKGFVGNRPRTWLSVTELGRITFNQHVKTLRSIVEQGSS